MMNRFTTYISSIINWWNRYRNDIFDIIQDIFIIFDRVSRNCGRLVAIGIILNVVNYFCPELAIKCPVIYSWFDGWRQLGEFALKGALGTIYSLFTGNLGEFYQKYRGEFRVLFHQLINWLSSLTF